MQICSFCKWTWSRKVSRTSSSPRQASIMSHPGDFQSLFNDPFPSSLSLLKCTPHRVATSQTQAKFEFSVFPCFKGKEKRQHKNKVQLMMKSPKTFQAHLVLSLQTSGASQLLRKKVLWSDLKKASVVTLNIRKIHYWNGSGKQRRHSLQGELISIFLLASKTHRQAQLSLIKVSLGTPQGNFSSILTIGK